MPDCITHRGFRVWLRDKDDKHLPLGHSTLNAAETEVSIPVDSEKRTLYAIDWCRVEHMPHINAICTILRPDTSRKGAGRVSKIGDALMSADDAASQRRTSVGRMEMPLDRKAWLSTAHCGGSVALEIRRLNEPPLETRSLDPDTQAEVLNMELDYFDSEDPNIVDPETQEAMPAFVTFIFRFPLPPDQEVADVKPTVAVPRSKTVPRTVPHSVVRSPAAVKRLQLPREPAQPWPTPSPARELDSAVILGKRPREEDDEDNEDKYTEEIDRLLAGNARAKARLQQIAQEKQQKLEEIESLSQQLKERAEEDQIIIEVEERQSAKLDARLERLREALA
ncbi:Mg transporter [Mycena kentingensis (nom. inval.)]|nr:Mg transporter [Mycena kentingensis (nom. inval.)]